MTGDRVPGLAGGCSVGARVVPGDRTGGGVQVQHQRTIKFHHFMVREDFTKKNK